MKRWLRHVLARCAGQPRLVASSQREALCHKCGGMHYLSSAQVAPVAKELAQRGTGNSRYAREE